MQVRALRIAAYLLIAHFVIVAGFAFAGQGSPDYMRLLMKAAILAIAVNALLKPRGRGWLIVLGYGIYILVEPAIGLWGVLSGSTPMPPNAKVVAVAVWGLINALPIVALVLTFIPAHFAAFKATPPDAARPDEPGAKP